MSRVDEYYEERLAGRGLAPAHVVAVKKVLTKAFRKGDKPGAAVKAFLKEKGITLKEADEAPPKEKANGKQAAPAEAPKSAKKAEPTPVIPLDQVEVRNMDRKSLKALAFQLKEMGSDIKVLKSDDDDVLRRKVSEALTALPSPEVIKTLESVDPAKLKQVLQQDCFGIYVDLRSPGCLSCEDNQECVKEYLKNLKGNFDIFKDVINEIKVEDEVEQVTPAIAEAQAKSSKASADGATKAVAIKYDAKRVVFVQALDKNPCPKKHTAHDTYAAIMAELSDVEVEDGKVIGPTMRHVRDIVEREFEIKDDDEFMEWFGYLRGDKVVRLDVDLTKDERKFFADNGVEV